MEMQKLVMHSVESSKENYNKVVIQKQMTYNFDHSNSSNRKMDDTQTSRDSPGIVKRRIMEMSSRLNQSSPQVEHGSSLGSRTMTTTSGRSTFERHSEMIHSASAAAASGATTRQNQTSGSVSPRFDSTSKFSKTLVSVELDPFEGPSSCSSSNHQAFKSLELNYPEDASLFLNAPSVKQRSVSFKSTTALTDLTEEPVRDCSSPPAPPLPHRSASLPRQSQKPAIPPKPRPSNTAAAATHSASASPIKFENEHISREQQYRSQVGHKSPVQQQLHQTPKGFNDSLCLTERAEPFNVSDHHNDSPSLEDQQRLEMLRRRQSYSEFEDLIEKKREIRERMLSKITLLRQERDILAKEKLDSGLFGQSIKFHLEQYASIPEINKYLQFLDEIEQITKLSVGLTIRIGRLSRKIETATTSREEKKILEAKKQKLEEQAQEAEFLHQNTDRRQVSIRRMLSKYLNEEELRQYDSFLVNLIKLITELKETEQRIQLGEEQLVALNDNLNSSSSSS